MIFETHFCISGSYIFEWCIRWRNEFMITRCFWKKEVKFNFLSLIVIAKRSNIKFYLIPILLSAWLVLNLRFVHRFVLTWLKKLPDDKENRSRLVDVTRNCKLDRFFWFFEFLSDNLNLSIILSSCIDNRLYKCLISWSNNLMNCELKISDVLLSSQIFWFCIVIHIVCLNQEGLSLLKEVIDSEACNKVWIKIIKNTLGSSNFHFNWLCSLLFQFI